MLSTCWLPLIKPFPVLHETVRDRCLHLWIYLRRLYGNSVISVPPKVCVFREQGSRAGVVRLDSLLEIISFIDCQLLGFPRIVMAIDSGECRILPIQRSKTVGVASVWNERSSDLVLGGGGGPCLRPPSHPSLRPGCCRARDTREEVSFQFVLQN